MGPRDLKLARSRARLYVSTPLGHTLIACEISVYDVVLLANLIVLGMIDFGVVWVWTG